MFATLVLAATLAGQPDPKGHPIVPPKLGEVVETLAKADDKDTPLRKLQKERVRERATYVKRMEEVYTIGQWDAASDREFTQMLIELMANLAELAEKPEDRVKCYEMRVEALKKHEEIITNLVKTGRDRAPSVNRAKAMRIDAEIDLMKLKGPDAKKAAVADDPEELVKVMIADMNALAAALDKKESPEKLKASAEKIKAAAEKIKNLKLPDDQNKKLSEKHGKELLDAVFRLAEAQAKNPDGAKAIGDLLKDLGK
jgi:hypothetical protein